MKKIFCYFLACILIPSSLFSMESDSVAKSYKVLAAESDEILRDLEVEHQMFQGAKQYFTTTSIGAPMMFHAAIICQSFVSPEQESSVLYPALMSSAFLGATYLMHKFATRQETLCNRTTFGMIRNSLASCSAATINHTINLLVGGLSPLATATMGTLHIGCAFHSLVSSKKLVLPHTEDERE